MLIGFWATDQRNAPIVRMMNPCRNPWPKVSSAQARAASMTYFRNEGAKFPAETPSIEGKPAEAIKAEQEQAAAKGEQRVIEQEAVARIPPERSKLNARS